MFIVIWGDEKHFETGHDDTRHYKRNKMSVSCVISEYVMKKHPIIELLALMNQVINEDYFTKHTNITTIYKDN